MTNMQSLQTPSPKPTRIPDNPNRRRITSIFVSNVCSGHTFVYNSSHHHYPHHHHHLKLVGAYLFSVFGRLDPSPSLLVPAPTFVI